MVTFKSCSCALVPLHPRWRFNLLKLHLCVKNHNDRVSLLVCDNAKARAAFFSRENTDVNLRLACSANSDRLSCITAESFAGKSKDVATDARRASQTKKNEKKKEREQA